MKTLRPPPVHIAASYPEMMYQPGYPSNYLSDQAHDSMIVQPTNYVSPQPYNIMTVSPVYYTHVPASTNRYLMVPPQAATFAYPSIDTQGQISVPIEEIRMEETMMQQMSSEHPYPNALNNNNMALQGNPLLQESGIRWPIAGMPVDNRAYGGHGHGDNLPERAEDDMILDDETSTQKTSILEMKRKETTPMAKQQLQTEKDLPYLADEKIQNGLYMRRIDRFEVIDEKGRSDVTCCST